MRIAGPPGSKLTCCLRPIVVHRSTRPLESGSPRGRAGWCAPAIWLLVCCASITLASTAGCRTEPFASQASENAQPPPDARRELKRLIGEYGAEDDWLTVYEADGQLFADGLGLHHAYLRPGATTQFS